MNSYQFCNNHIYILTNDFYLLNLKKFISYIIYEISNNIPNKL